MGAAAAAAAEKHSPLLHDPDVLGPLIDKMKVGPHGSLGACGGEGPHAPVGAQCRFEPWGVCCLPDRCCALDPAAVLCRCLCGAGHGGEEAAAARAGECR